MRPALALLVVVLAGCGNKIGIGIDETDTDLGPNEDTDELVDPRWDSAELRILEPASGSFLALEDSHAFTAEVTDADGVPMEVDGLAWSSSIDSAWVHDGLAFEDATLGIGTHDITARVELPNGDRLSYTAGGILVQSKWAGTYAGLFSADLTGEYQGQPITVTCSGSTVMIVDATGEGATGSADCLLSLIGFDLPATFVFDLTNADGTLGGTAAVDLGFFDIPMDATGGIDLDTSTLTVEFGGEIPTIGSLAGTVDAVRVSRDVDGG